jgi:DNA-nicking Smr family endonuclease
MEELMRKFNGKNSEFTLFREAMRDVKRLKCDKVAFKPLPLLPYPKQRDLDEQLVRQEMLSDEFEPVDLETGEELLFMRPGIQRQIFAQLRRGHFSITTELDLHGMIAREAQVEVADFLRHCRENNTRCVKIVHGKGNGSWQKQPVLKNKLNQWLRQRDEVLAFCSARPCDGGTGAIYVLLKKRK